MVRRVRQVWHLWRGPERAIAEKLRYAHAHGQAVVLTRAEGRVMFDRMVRRQLKMSGKEFLARMDRGELPDSPAAEHLAILAGGARTR
jgi:hypothetical protein